MLFVKIEELENLLTTYYNPEAQQQHRQVNLTTVCFILIVNYTEADINDEDSDW